MRRDVQKDGVRALGAGLLEALGARGGQEDLVSLVLEGHLEGLADIRLVVDDQDPLSRCEGGG
jgi:hypothetical protein